MTTTPGTMRRSKRTSVAIAAAAIVLLTTVALGALRDTTPAGAAADDRPVTGYTLLDLSVGPERLCQLVEVDWASGEVTVLPAAASAESCVNDLAVDPDGTVHGFTPLLIGDTGLTGDVVPSVATVVGRFVTYAADGTPSSMNTTLPASYEILPDPFGQFWGIAIAEDGTIFVIINQLWAQVSNCEPGPLVGAVDYPSLDGEFGWTSCLFTLDPATGDLTLVGPSTAPGDVLLGMSLGRDGARTLLYSAEPLGIDPSIASTAYWTSLDLESGAIEPTAIAYLLNYGLYDQLRGLPGIFALLRDDTSGDFQSGTVDPTTGALTVVAPLMIDSVPIGGDGLWPVLGITGGPAPAPDPVVPSFTG